MHRIMISVSSKEAEIYAEWSATGRPPVREMARRYGVNPEWMSIILRRHPEYRAYQQNKYPNRKRVANYRLEGNNGNCPST